MTDTSVYFGKHGIHRVPLWRIAGFALNNTATKLYLFLMYYVSFYLMGFVGVGMVAASGFAMMMRIWDGVTDPIIGFLVDKTKGRFGKNRPFMVLGNLLMCVTSFFMLHLHRFYPGGSSERFTLFCVIGAIYYIGYTFQCVATKSAQACLTNDPKQRPLFASFDAVYTAVLLTGAGMLAPMIAQANGGYSGEGFFHVLWIAVSVSSAFFTVIAVLAIAPKDRPAFFGTGKPVRITLKDYWNTVKGNRAVRMLLVAASTDQLAAAAKTSAVSVAMFACLAGSTLLQTSIIGLTAVPGAAAAFLAISVLASRMGQKKAMLLGSWGGILVNGGLACLWLFGDPASMTSDPATGAVQWGFFTIAFVAGTILQSGFQGLSGGIVIPMIADCADYEVYRSGRYVPGLMGALFSFTEKLVSSLAPLIAGLVFAYCGFPDHNPVEGDPVTAGLRYGVVFLAYGIVMLGLLCNILALRYYPLTKEKMAEIQNEVASIKARLERSAE